MIESQQLNNYFKKSILTQNKQEMLRKDLNDNKLSKYIT